MAVQPALERLILARQPEFVLLLHGLHDLFPESGEQPAAGRRFGFDAAPGEPGHQVTHFAAVSIARGAFGPRGAEATSAAMSRVQTTPTPERVRSAISQEAPKTSEKPAAR